MRSCFFNAVLAAAVVCSLSFPAAAAPVSPDELTGAQWKLSTNTEKLAFLYGASNIVAIEHLVAEKQGNPPSPFVSAWLRTFGDSSWTQIQKLLDDWYAEHPGEVERPVFDVLWYEFMAPSGK